MCVRERVCVREREGERVCVRKERERYRDKRVENWHGTRRDPFGIEHGFKV